MFAFILFAVLILPETQGLILPLTKQDGTVDLNSLLNHVTLLEQTVSSFQTELQTTKTDLQVTKSDLQKTTSALEIAVKALQDQQKQCETDISALKGEVSAVEGELETTSKDLRSVKSEMSTLQTELPLLKISVNTTVLDSIRNDLKSNMADIHTLQADYKTVQQALYKVNASVEVCASEVWYVKKNVSDVARSFNQEMTSVKADLLNVSFVLNEVASNLTSTAINLSHVSNVSRSNQAEQNAMKTEISNISSTLTQVQTNLTSSVSETRNISDSLSAVLSQLRSTTSDIAVVRSDMAALRRNLSGIEMTSHNNSQFVEQLLLQTGLKKTSVAFHVYGIGKRTGKGPILFSHYEYNIDHCYSFATGKFTAPVSGIYIFLANLAITQTYQATYLRIMESNSIKDQTYGAASTAQRYVTIHGFAILHLVQGEEVWLTSTSDIIAPGNGDSTSAFAGALLSAD